MMNVFNRRKVYASMEFESACQMRAKIQKGHLECQMVRKNLNRSSGWKSPSDLGPTLIEYQLYVHRQDVEMAQYLMNQPVYE